MTNSQESATPDETISYAPFPTEVLPPTLQTFVDTGAKSIGVDPAFLAVPLLSACASAIGNTRRALVKDGWAEPCVLWTAIVAPSGSAKSPALDLTLSFIRDVEHHKIQLILSKHKDETMHAKENNLPVPDPPVLPRHILSDTTMEATVALLADQPRGLLLARDELSGWFGNMDRYANKAGGDAPQWLEMYGARSVTVDRKGAPPIFVPRASVSITGTIQPAVIATLFGKGMRDNGMAFRFLIAAPPPSPKRWTDDTIEPAVLRSARSIIKHLFNLQGEPKKGTQLEPIDRPFSDDAADLKRDWVNSINERAGVAAEDEAPAYPKIEGAAFRLALIIHELKLADGVALEHSYEISRASLECGITLAEWFLANGIRLVRNDWSHGEQHLQKQILAVLSSREEGLTAREVKQKVRAAGSVERLAEILNGLVESGRAACVDPPSSANPGRPAGPRYTAVSAAVTPSDP